MKKLISIILAMATSVVIMGGCSNSEEANELPKPSYTISEDYIETKDANDEMFSAANVTKKENSPLDGKIIYWLGSSVTYGSAAEGESMADYIAALTGAVCKKDAVSGTTIFDDGGTGDSGEFSYTRRLVNSTVFDKNEKIDAFVCQISTNDAHVNRIANWGSLTDDGIIATSEFDKSTTIGGLEFIIAYVTETWNCPVYFYSGSNFTATGVRSSTNPTSDNYGRLVNRVERVVEKWNKVEGVETGVINLFEDTEFNAAVSDTYYEWSMSNAVHPKRAAYLQWWAPMFENYLIIHLTMDS